MPLSNNVLKNQLPFSAAHTITTFKLTKEDKDYDKVMGCVRNFPGDARSRLNRAAAKANRNANVRVSLLFGNQ